MDELSDEEIIGQFLKSGETAHIDVLLTRHVAKVRSMIYPMVLNDADADDLTQKVLLKAFNALGSFGGRAKFASWLYRIAMNTTNSFLRTRSRNPMVPHEIVPEPESDTTAIGATLGSCENEERIGRAMDSLSPVLRAAITLVAINGLSIREAANAEGCVMATMYWRLHEGKRLLKQMLM
jgi:RNA polymerase sigma-70 factor (ECF subfamily)